MLCCAPPFCAASELTALIDLPAMADRHSVN
jgi:hypothetical protein